MEYGSIPIATLNLSQIHHFTQIFKSTLFSWNPHESKFPDYNSPFANTYHPDWFRFKGLALCHYSNRNLDIRISNRQSSFPWNIKMKRKISFIPLNRVGMVRKYLYSHVSSSSRKYACSPCDAVALVVHCNIRIWCRSWISVWFAHFVWTSNSFPSQIVQHSGISFAQNGSLSMEGSNQEVPVDQSINKMISTEWQLLFTMNPPQINSRVIWL